MKSRSLALLGARPAGHSLPSPDQLDALGKPESAKEIAARWYLGKVSARWVLDHHAPDDKTFIGREAVWYEQHTRAWMPTYIQQQRDRAQKRRRAS